MFQNRDIVDRVLGNRNQFTQVFSLWNVGSDFFWVHFGYFKLLWEFWKIHANSYGKTSLPILPNKQRWKVTLGPNLVIHSRNHQNISCFQNHSHLREDVLYRGLVPDKCYTVISLEHIKERLLVIDWVNWEVVSVLHCELLCFWEGYAYTKSKFSSV